MGNEGKLTVKEFEEIKELVDKAINTSNKMTAEPYIKLWEEP